MALALVSLAACGPPDEHAGAPFSLARESAPRLAYVRELAAGADGDARYALWGPQDELAAPEGGAGAGFGGAVSVSHDTALVGAPYDDVGPNFGQGSAYVFVRSGGTWTLAQRLTASDGGSSDRFGAAVSVSGDTALVGAPSHDSGGNDGQGSAYVFVRGGGGFTLEQKLTASDGAAGDDFGAAVGLSGDTALVGAGSDDVGASVDQGSAYVFVRSGASWSEEQRLVASDGVAGDYFGEAVGLSGDTALVGAAYADGGPNPNQGAVYAFSRGGSVWTEQQRLGASDGLPWDGFGTAVSVEADTALVGAAYADQNRGAAYVFARSGGSWLQRQRLAADDGAADDYFGWSVSVAGAVALAGAYGDDVAANAKQGSAYLFEHGASAWSQVQKLTAAGGAPGDAFGLSVSLSDGTALVGAPERDVGAASDSGAAYAFVTTGAPCASGADCPLTGHCADGVCCNTACDDPCGACDVPGFVGVCSPTPQGTAADPSCEFACDGVGLGCATRCSSAADCAPYACTAGICATTCVTTADCAAGNVCDAERQCVADERGAAVEDGGCAVRAPPDSSKGGVLVAVVCGLLLVGRRRGALAGAASARSWRTVRRAP